MAWWSSEPRQPKAMNSVGLTKWGRGGAGGLKGGEFQAFAAVALEVEEEDACGFLGDVEIAVGGGGDVNETRREDDTGGLQGETISGLPGWVS